MLIELSEAERDRVLLALGTSADPGLRRLGEDLAGREPAESECVIRQRPLDGGYKVWVDGEPGCWGWGASPDEALGRLVSAWPERFGIAAIRPAEEPTRFRAGEEIDITGGLDSAEHVRRLRDEED